MPTSSRFAIIPRALQFEWGIFMVIVIVLTLPFWFTDLDIHAAQFFFHPDNGENLWPEENFLIPLLAFISLILTLFIFLSSIKWELGIYFSVLFLLTFKIGIHKFIACFI